MTMTKILGVLKILTNKAFLIALFLLIGTLFPFLAPWMAINSPALVTSISTISTTFAVLTAFLAESPKSKSIRLNGGEKDVRK